uniref:Uncharacterized protein n=1 Tax=Anguilla anguilla TaxID=7936 RepID=A0A0E9Y0S4_ANGAN
MQRKTLPGGREGNSWPLLKTVNIVHCGVMNLKKLNSGYL